MKESKVIEMVQNGRVFELTPKHFAGRYMTIDEMKAIFNVFDAFWEYEGRPSPEKYHALLKSEKHSNGFIACNKVLRYPNLAEIFAYEITKQIGDEIEFIDVVVSSAYSAVSLGYEVAKIISKDYNRKVEYQIIEKDSKGNPTILREGINAGKLVLVVNELMTTGSGSTWESKKAILECNGENPAPETLLSSYVLVHRSKDYILPDGSSVYPIFHFDMEDFDSEEDCPYCYEGSKAIKPKQGNNWNLIHGREID